MEKLCDWLPNDATAFFSFAEHVNADQRPPKTQRQTSFHAGVAAALGTRGAEYLAELGHPKGGCWHNY